MERMTHSVCVVCLAGRRFCECAPLPMQLAEIHAHRYGLQNPPDARNPTRRRRRAPGIFQLPTFQRKFRKPFFPSPFVLDYFHRYCQPCDISSQRRSILKANVSVASVHTICVCKHCVFDATNIVRTSVPLPASWQKETIKRQACISRLVDFPKQRFIFRYDFSHPKRLQVFFFNVSHVISTSRA